MLWGKVQINRDYSGCSLSLLNPFLYRGYVYDYETKLYYLNSRYYDPELGRFLNADSLTVLPATAIMFSDINLYTYCDNDPVNRVDYSATFWESAFDIISLGASVVEVCLNPTDIMNWASLVGDTVDLIPFVTGVGEVTRTIKVTNKVVKKGDDVIDAAKAIRSGADAADDIRKATGSYEILYDNGYHYIGKGSFDRAITSAKQHLVDGAKVTDIRWKSAPTPRQAFIDEYMMQKRFGGVNNSSKTLQTYNKIWSPGKKYLGE